MPASAVAHVRASHRFQMRIGTLIALMLAVVASTARADETLERQLAEGDIIVTAHEVENFDIPPLLTQAIIKAPPEKVFALVDDCNIYKSYIPRVASSSELQRDGNHSVCRFLIDMPAPMDDLSSTIDVTRTLTPGKWRREFKHMDGNFLRNDGVWTLTPYGKDGQQTRVEYRLHSAFKTMLPNAFVRMGQRGAMKDLIKNMRKRLEPPTD